MEFQNTEELAIMASKYQYEKSENLVQIFKDNHIYFPDFIHRFILLSLLKKYIFSSELMSTYTDEYKYKLRSYNYFSIYILEKAITDYNIDIKAHEYKNLFMRFYLKNENKFKSSVALLKSLEAINSVEPIKEESIKVCLNEFQSIYYTPKGYLDGISLSLLKESITLSYNINEVKGLGLKYNVDIPKRVNKNQLIDLLSARLQLTAEEKTSIETKPISEICAYAKNKGFRISSELKKQDMVEYLIFALDKYYEEVEKDIYNYDIILESEKELENIIEQDEVKESDQGLPTSSELVDRPENIEPKEIVRDYSLDDEQVETPIIEEIALEPVTNEEPLIETEIIEEPLDITESSKLDNIKEENNSINEIEPNNVNEEVKIESSIISDTKTNETKKETETTTKNTKVLEFDDYNEEEDQEIRSIIKKYYHKKNIKDKRFKYLVIGLLCLIIIGIFILIIKK